MRILKILMIIIFTSKLKVHFTSCENYFDFNYSYMARTITPQTRPFENSKRLQHGNRPLRNMQNVMIWPNVTNIIIISTGIVLHALVLSQ